MAVVRHPDDGVLHARQRHREGEGEPYATGLQCPLLAPSPSTLRTAQSAIVVQVEERHHSALRLTKVEMSGGPEDFLRLSSHFGCLVRSSPMASPQLSQVDAYASRDSASSIAEQSESLPSRNSASTRRRSVIAFSLRVTLFSAVTDHLPSVASIFPFRASRQHLLESVAVRRVWSRQDNARRR